MKKVKITQALTALWFWIFILFGITCTVNAAPVQWTAGNGHWYEYIRTSETWDDAAASASSKTFNGYQGHLATITTPEENIFVWNSLSTSGTGNGGPRGAWLGGYQSNDAIVPAGNWNWVTGEGWDYTCWHPGGPNDGGPDYLENNERNHLGFNSSYDIRTWGDHNSSETRNYIIEYEANPVPIPSTISLLGLGLFGLAAVGRRKK